VTWLLVMGISIAMAVCFVLGRIWSRFVRDLRSVWMANYEEQGVLFGRFYTHAHRPYPNIEPTGAGL